MAQPPMASLAVVTLVVGLGLGLASPVAAGSAFSGWWMPWGASDSSISPFGISLLLDNTSGSAVQSSRAYLFGSFEMLLKLVPNNSAGTVTAYYISSTGSYHDEIDFEFLGNVSGQPIVIHTNLFANGMGKKEQQFFPWFDPADGFHNYTIHWNPSQVVWYVDSVPIRVYRKFWGIPYPERQGMRVYASLWNADNWATRGGKDKIDWESSPFIARLKRFRARACWYGGRSSVRWCASKAGGHWWTLPAYSRLSSADVAKMNGLRAKYMIYDYCKDYKRFKGLMPAECFKPQY